VRDDKHIWTKARLDCGGAFATKLCDGSKVEIVNDFLLCSDKSEEPSSFTQDDMTNLLHIHEASILENLEVRFKQGNCCTFIGSVLLSVNPIRAVLEPTQLVGKKTVLGIPHPFSVAESSFQQLERESSSQCIIISGESGSGKSETCKRVLQHLVVRAGEACMVDDQLLAASPILESFGNASTCSNLNSSRFGKFFKLYFSTSDSGQTNTFHRATIETYLLERCRVTFHDPNERTFHIFYQLFAGSDAQLRKILFFDTYRCPLEEHVSVERDQARFEKLTESLCMFGFRDTTIGQIFQLVAAVMHLTQIKFEDQENGSEGMAATTTIESENALMACSSLLGVGTRTMLDLLCKKTICLRGETIVSSRNAEASSQARDALAKAIYKSLFDWVVLKINNVLGETGGSEYSSNPCAKTNFVGVLDIFGFECFERNSLEQLLINFANEALQRTFNKHLFEAELNLYRSEGLDISALDGSPADETCLRCYDLFRGDGTLKSSLGLLSSMDAISVGPEPSDSKLVAHFHQTYLPHPCFLQTHPRLRESTFIIQHYAGPVSYSVQGFVEKNIDTLPKEAEQFLSCSSRLLVQQIFETQAVATGRNVMARRSVSKKFEMQIDSLTKVLDGTSCSFIRCVKPNVQLTFAHGFSRPYVTKQLKCLSIPQTVKLLQSGLPGRVPYTELYATFHSVLPLNMKDLPKSLHNVVIATILQHGLGIPKNDVKLGRLRAFFAAGTLAMVDKKLRSFKDGEAIVPPSLGEKIEIACAVHASRRLLVVAGGIRRYGLALQKKKLRRATAAIRIQASVRCCFARTRFYKLLHSILQLQKTLRENKSRSLAAVHVQTFIRCSLERRRFIKLVRSVRILQKVWKQMCMRFMYSDDSRTICTESTSSNLASSWSFKVGDDEMSLSSFKMGTLNLREDDEESYPSFKLPKFIEEAPTKSLFEETYTCEEAEEDQGDEPLIADATLVMDQSDEEDANDGGYSADEDDEDQEGVNDTSLQFLSIPDPCLHLTQRQQATKNIPSNRPARGGSEELTNILRQLSSSSSSSVTEKKDEEVLVISERLLEKSSIPLEEDQADQREHRPLSRKSSNPGAHFEHLLDEWNRSFSSTSTAEGIEKVNSANSLSGKYETTARESSSKAGKNSRWSIKLPGIFRVQKKEERTLTRRLKAGMKKKHYRQLIETLVRARELGLQNPEVTAAESMVYRVKSIHTQQLLREAMVLRDAEALDQAVSHAEEFGMDSTQSLMQQALEMQRSMKRKSQLRASRETLSFKLPKTPSTTAS